MPYECVKCKRKLRSVLWRVPFSGEATIRAQPDDPDGCSGSTTVSTGFRGVAYGEPEGPSCPSCNDLVVWHATCPTCDQYKPFPHSSSVECSECS